MSGELRFDGRVAIVTGGGRGMGRSHARFLASRGAKVVVNDLSSGDSPADAVAAEIEAAGGAAVACAVDITEEGSAEAVYRCAIDRFGGLDILVNNAGIIRPTPFEELEPAAFDRNMKVNAYGPYFMTRAVWPHFRSQGYGRIVMVSSEAGIIGYPNRVDYSSSKAAMIGMARALSCEAASTDSGIKINILFPSAATGMSSDLQKEYFAERFGLSTDELFDKTQLFVSFMVAWLAHEECTTNGEILVAGGGEFRRIVFAATVGYENVEATFEVVRDRLEEIMDTNDSQQLPAYNLRPVSAVASRASWV